MAEHIPVVPNLEVPTGNWIARNLRLLNEDSKELFPASPAARPHSNKFDSIYKVDYHDFPTEAFLEGLREKGKEPKRQTIRDVLFGNSPSEVFQNWKVPDRLVPEKEFNIDDQDALRAVITGKRGKAGQTRPELLRQQTLPAILSSREQKLERAPVLVRETPIRCKSSAAEIDYIPSTRDRLQQTLQPHTVNVANGWLKTAPIGDRKVINRLLRMQEKKHQLDNAMKKSLLPDARKRVDEWLETATESERQVALKFFSSVAGAKLLGCTGEEQKGKVQQVLKTLRSQRARGTGGPAVCQSMDMSSAEKESKLKFVRLLDDQTRANRWMHTTWHHLPEYKNDNPVSNKSSHYIRPHAPTPRHFVIHPDWG